MKYNLFIFNYGVIFFLTLGLFTPLILAESIDSSFSEDVLPSVDEEFLQINQDYRELQEYRVNSISLSIVLILLIVTIFLLTKNYNDFVKHGLIGVLFLLIICLLIGLFWGSTNSWKYGIEVNSAYIYLTYPVFLLLMPIRLIFQQILISQIIFHLGGFILWFFIGVIVGHIITFISELIANSGKVNASKTTIIGFFIGLTLAVAMFLLVIIQWLFFSTGLNLSPALFTFAALSIILGTLIGWFIGKFSK